MIADLLQQGGLSFERLQSFCLVADAGGVTKAAKGDTTRQSLYSRQIKELEEFFGTELIRRKGRGIALTPAGQRLHLIAREAFASLYDFKQECKQQAVQIVIGAGESLVQWLLMPRLEQVRRTLPNVRFKFLNLPTSDSVKRLADGMIDLAIVRADAVTRPLKSARLGTFTYSLFLPKGQKPTTANSRLNDLPIATLEGDGSFRRDLAAAAAREKIGLNIEIECSTFTLAANAVARGAMAAILPSIAAEQLSIAGVTCVEVPFLKNLSREICLTWNPRLIRIRPVLLTASEALRRLCAF